MQNDYNGLVKAYGFQHKDGLISYTALLYRQLGKATGNK